MLTTTVDGLWVLQVLSGIEVLAPELGLRPHLPSVETKTAALSHPAARELRDAGVIDARGATDAAVVEWLTVVTRRDVALLLYIQSPGAAGPERILLARLAQWWVALERYGPLVRLSGAGVATNAVDAGLLISAQIDRLCGALPPADMRPLSIDTDLLLAHVRGGGGLSSFLTGLKIEPGQLRFLSAAADTAGSAQGSIVAIQSGERPHITPCAVTIMDTPHGRLISEQVVRDGRTWMIVSPGSASSIASAVHRLLRQTPAGTDWYRHRKVV